MRNPFRATRRTICPKARSADAVERLRERAIVVSDLARSGRSGEHRLYQRVDVRARATRQPARSASPSISRCAAPRGKRTFWRSSCPCTRGFPGAQTRVWGDCVNPGASCGAPANTCRVNRARDLPLLAAWRLRVPSRALRPLARGDHGPLRSWLQSESALRLAEARRDANEDLVLLERLGARLVTPDDAEWPRGFDDLRDPPAFMAVRGAPLGGGPPDAVAIVGARDADEPACEFAYELAMRLGRTVVSGLARGIDAAAHRGALAANLSTVAYVGTGIALTYPPEHEALAEAIVVRGGTLTSESAPHDRATTWSLTRRDRLQAAHAAAVVLIQSDASGGAMHTLRFARELGRLRFALEDEASGNAAALAAGALPLPRSADEAASRILSVLRDKENASSSNPL